MKELKCNFLPWVGKDYSTGGIFKKRILVLGESHYCANEKDAVPSLTNDVVEAFLDEEAERERWMNTYLKFERSLVGYETNAHGRRPIWDSLMFYNFLQVPITGPRKSGTIEDYENAKVPFFEILDVFHPENIIVWGQRLWSYLSKDSKWTWYDDIFVDGEYTLCGNYAMTDGSLAKIIAVNHPSSAYSWDYWHRVISAFLSIT